MFVASSHNKTEIKQIELGLQKNLVEFRHCHELNEVKISHDLWKTYLESNCSQLCANTLNQAE